MVASESKTTVLGLILWTDKSKRLRGRPVKYPIPDAPENVMRALLEALLRREND